MTQRLDALPFLRAGRAAAVIGFAAAAIALSGCTSTNIEDVAPTASTAPQSMLPAAAPAPTGAQHGTATTGIVDAPVETVAIPAGPVSSKGPKNTGTFPNLNIKPNAANAQISDEERAAELAALRAAQAEHDATLPTADKGTTDPVLLRKLAAEHADDALKQIEGK